MLRNRSILISGAGIGGPTLAWWLKRYGFQPTLVERAPALRSGGYVIDFWGLGYDIAERMGLQPQIEAIGYHMQALRIADSNSRRIAGFNTSVFEALTGGRYVTLGRSDLSRLIFQQLGDTETKFGDTVNDIRQMPNGVHVTFERSPARTFDLVLGADGLHSVVRRLMFGAQHRFERRLGYSVAAFQCSGYRPREEAVYVVYGLPGQQVARFALHDDRTLFLFVFADEEAGAAFPQSVAEQKALIGRRFADTGWECAAIIEAMQKADDIYFDRVSQIRMDRWSQGRVALIGDAAFCVSLLAGQGAALAMTSAYVLAGELAEAEGNPDIAFPRYEQRLRSFIERKQKVAERFARWFVPRTRLGMVVRNQITNLFRIPAIARFTIGRDLADTLELPEYRISADTLR